MGDLDGLSGFDGLEALKHVEDKRSKELQRLYPRTLGDETAERITNLSTGRETEFELPPNNKVNALGGRILSLIPRFHA